MLQRSPRATGILPVPGHGRDGHGTLQGQDGLATVPPIVHDVLRSPGEALDAATRAALEPRFGHDFSRIKVHADAKAADSARQVNALAYTVGEDVVFARGQYQPGSSQGQRLIAHELTHTIQQAGGTSLRGAGPSESRLEGEAQAVSRAALEGREVSVAARAPLGLSRQPAPGAAPDVISGATPAAVVATDPDTIDGFATGSAVITPANQGKLQAIAVRIQSALKERPDSRVRVVGHTDAQGQEGDNFKLGMRRAEATRDALIKLAVPAKNIDIASKGQTEPVDASPQKDNPRNRRVEVKYAAPAAPLAPVAPAAPAVPQQMDPHPPADPQKQTVDWCQMHPELCLHPEIVPPPKPGPRRDPDPEPPPEPRYHPNLGNSSFSDWLKKTFVAPVVKAVTPFLGKSLQDKLIDLANDGVLKGTTAGLDKAMQAWGVDEKGRNAIINAVDAAIKQKGQSMPGGAP
jgi:outer membrane protein OmpA-like peptidoglycan-associated protein